MYYAIFKNKKFIHSSRSIKNIKMILEACAVDEAFKTHSKKLGENQSLLSYAKQLEYSVYQMVYIF